VKRRNPFSAFRWISLAFIFAAVILTVLQLIRYSRIRANFPAGMVIAGIPVGNLDRAQSANRLLLLYSTPVELRYNNAVIQIKPSLAGFDLDLEGMLTAADMQRVSQPFWTGFWDYLWNRNIPTTEVPLRSNISEERLREYLVNEIAARYDEPPTPPIPIPGTTSFQPGKPGNTLNIDRAILLIGEAFRSPKQRTVNLSFENTQAPRPAIQNLQVLIQQIIQLNNFDGIVDVYLEDLQTSEALHFALQNGSSLPVTPDIAFSAESAIKIPIMVSTFRRVDEPTPQDIIDSLTLMIQESGNNPADVLMDKVLTKGVGPLEVTQDMQMIGLQNTFLGAYMARPDFLDRIETPANQRTDIVTDPDPFSQTTPLDMGSVLEDIYMCANNGGGALVAAFPDKITQAECQRMIALLAGNKTVAILLEAGLPEGTQIAHKHAYATEADGLIHTMGDSGIIYTSGGNYIISIFMYHPVQVVWDPVNQMVAQISEAVYNYFNTK
jgi:beta-lactamase class A